MNERIYDIYGLKGAVRNPGEDLLSGTFLIGGGIIGRRYEYWHLPGRDYPHTRRIPRGAPTSENGMVLLVSKNF